MNGPIRRIAGFLFLAFGLLLLNVTYIQAIATSTYRDNPLNPRVAASISGKERGRIVTSDGTVVARSIADPGDPSRFAREYPEGPVYAQVVGYSSLLFGDEGLERVYANDLRSRRDLTLSDVINALMGRDLRPKSLELTIDDGLQHAAFDAMGDNTGAVVAIDPKTGAVLAMVSTPSYDPGVMLAPNAAELRAALLEDPEEPLANRAVARTYPPGSTFKVVVASSAVENGIAGPTTTFDDPIEFPLPGSTSTIRNYDRGPCGDGTTVTLSEAFRKSCNTIFATLGLQVGAQTLYDTAVSFSFDEPIRFDLPTQESFFPDPSDLDGPALAQSSIGERDVRATPLEMASIAAAVANGGNLMQPYLVSRIVDAAGETVSEVTPEIRTTAVSAATATIVSQMMEEVVASGTGTRATVPNVRVAGKTGTSDASSGSPAVWFIGFAPVEDPTIAIAVVVLNGGEDATGGSVAAPIAGQILSYWLQP
jgi:peptidoglycan glycosyltransferase